MLRDQCVVVFTVAAVLLLLFLTVLSSPCKYAFQNTSRGTLHAGGMGVRRIILLSLQMQRFRLFPSFVPLFDFSYRSYVPYRSFSSCLNTARQRHKKGCMSNCWGMENPLEDSHCSMDLQRRTAGSSAHNTLSKWDDSIRHISWHVLHESQGCGRVGGEESMFIWNPG